MSCAGQLRDRNVRGTLSTSESGRPTCALASWRQVTVCPAAQASPAGGLGPTASTRSRGPVSLLYLGGALSNTHWLRVNR